ncbi:MAG: hypothetical protein E7538_08305 [Ruminococcaceae bacterium]|nr:hypothetical protein [Oscillospiraceae bacterium]
MKKIISFFLATVMLFAFMAPAASAANAYEYLPTIYIRGNGETLCYPDGTVLAATMEDLSLGGEEGGIDKDTIVESAVNILKPFVLEGMLFDKWDNYGRAIYDEISPLFKDAGLDYDGNPKAGTGVTKERQELKERLPYSKWEYNNKHDYEFIYDWRLSPYDYVDELHTFITTIMTTTGKTQVNIWGRCLGGGLLMAYLDKYGDLGHIKNVMFAQVLSNEATVISKAFSGQVEFDAKLVEKYAGQLDYCGRRGEGVGFVFSDMLNEIVIKTMDFFNQVYVTDAALDTVEDLYNKLYKALMPAMLHAVGMATQVNYWTAVAEEDMDAALDLMFGKEGTELRTKYAGLIDKIELYRENVASDLDGFYEDLKANGIHFGFLANYGYLNAPFTKDAELQSDALVSLTHATFGATVAPVCQTLTDDYILQRVAEGKEKYISPDKVVDLSTCVSPDTTWVVKNAHHNNFGLPFNDILYSFLNGTNETVDSLGASQFLIYDGETNTISALTAENDCELEFMTRSTENPTIASRLSAFFRFFAMLLDYMLRLVKGELDFSGLLG